MSKRENEYINNINVKINVKFKTCKFVYSVYRRRPSRMQPPVLIHHARSGTLAEINVHFMIYIIIYLQYERRESTMQNITPRRAGLDSFLFSIHTFNSHTQTHTHTAVLLTCKQEKKKTHRVSTHVITVSFCAYFQIIFTDLIYIKYIILYEMVFTAFYFQP